MPNVKVVKVRVLGYYGLGEGWHYAQLLSLSDSANFLMCIHCGLLVYSRAS